MSKKKRGEKTNNTNNEKTAQTAGEYIEMNDNLEESMEAPKK